MWSEKCKLWSVECSVWSVEGGVQSVNLAADGLRSLDLFPFCPPLSSSPVFGFLWCSTVVSSSLLLLSWHSFQHCSDGGECASTTSSC